MDCIFCKIISGEIPSTKIYEDEVCLAFLDIQPVNPGHTLLIPKIHTENFSSTPEGALEHLIKVAKKVCKAVQLATHADGFNFTTSNGSAAGQEIMHLHFHIIPRHPGDRHLPWGRKGYKAGEAAVLAASIQEQLS